MNGETDTGGNVVLRHHHEADGILSPEFVDKLHASPKGSLLTFGATPLDRVATVDQQRAVRENRQELADNPPLTLNIPPMIVRQVSSTFRERFEHRGEANDENFHTALESDSLESFDEATQEMLFRARYGNASPAELLYLRNTLGIRSIELACLTHPYGQGIEDLKPMRDAVKGAVELHQGQYFAHAVPRFAIKEAIVEKNRLVGLVITRKRMIGMMPDDTIIRERSSFILRMDSPAIDNETRKMLLAYNHIDLTWGKQLIDETQLEDVIKMLLETDAFADAIPVSTTIYAYNERTAAEIAVLEEERREERRQKLRESFPELMATLEAMKPSEEKETVRRMTFNTVNGMYVNTNTEIRGLPQEK